MYEDFFGLKGRPFELSPDPFFLFSSERTREALASISYAVARRKGFVVITGEVGTGKTLLLRCLFELWEREGIPFAYIIGPRLSTVDFLSYITFELGIEVTEPTKGNLLRALYGFLLDQFERGLTTVLVIDEAHQIPQSVLEEIRMLANFETAQQKLIQVLLVGQPELDKKLDSSELRSLKQRIATRCQLQPLCEEEIGRYVERRLELSGADIQAASIFPVGTISAIFRYSAGIPRLVNSICDQALIVAYKRKVRVVPVEVIDEVASHFRLSPDSGLKQTSKPLLLLNQIENSGPDISSLSLPVANLPAVGIRHPEPISNSLNEPPNRETKAPSSPPDPSALSDTSALVNAANQTLRSAWVSSLAAGPSFIAPAVAPLRARKLGIDSAMASAGRRVIYSFNTILKSMWLSRSRRWLTPMIRLSLLSGAAAIVAVSLATPVIMSNRQIEEVTPASQAVASMPPAPANSAARFGAASVISLELPRQPAAAPQLLVERLEASDRGSMAVRPSSSNPALAAGPDSTTAPARNIIALRKPSAPITKGVVLTSSEAPSIQTDPSISPLNNLALLVGSAAEPPPVPSAAVPSTLGGHLQDPELISSTPPVYPPGARAQDVQGVVTLDALVDETGTVVETKVIAGPLPLQAAAEAALKGWRYQAARLNGKPIQVHTKVSIRFSLN